MKYLTLSICVLLTSCATTSYNPFEDEKISNSPICQSSLNTLVENDSFMEVKSLVDEECNNIVTHGWVKGKIDNAFDRRCKASFQYFVQRKELQKVAKEFLQNECYPENPGKYYWKSLPKNT